MARYNRKRRRRAPYRKRKRAKYAVRLPMKKKIKYTLDQPGICLFRGGFHLEAARGEQNTSALGSLFGKDIINTADFTDYCAKDMLDKVYGAANVNATSKIFIGDVKRVWQFTNSSVSQVMYQIYRLRARKDAYVPMATILADAAWQRAEDLPAEENIIGTTIGGTPYDNPTMTNQYKIKPVKRGVLAPGGTGQFSAKRNIRSYYSNLEISTYDGITTRLDAGKYSDYYIIVFHGQPCSGVNAGPTDVVTYAQAHLDVASYARLTYALVLSEGIQTTARMESTNPFAASVSATLYTPGNIAATSAAGVPDDVLA